MHSHFSTAKVVVIFHSHKKNSEYLASKTDGF